MHILLYLLACLMLVYSLLLVFTSNFNMGNLIIWVLTAACWVYAVWQRGIHAWLHGTLPGRIVFWLLVAGAALTVAVLAFLLTSAYANPPTGQEKVIVVLGAGLRQDRPSRLLRWPPGQSLCIRRCPHRTRSWSRPAARGATSGCRKARRCVTI